MSKLSGSVAGLSESNRFTVRPTGTQPSHVRPNPCRSRAAGLQAGVVIGHSILDFALIYEPRLQQLRNYSTTIRDCSSTTPPLLVYWQFHWQSFRRVGCLSAQSMCRVAGLEPESFCRVPKEFE